MSGFYDPLRHARFRTTRGAPIDAGFREGTQQLRDCICRRDIKRAQASAAEYKILYAFDSARDLCRSPEVDAILVATPNSFHLNDVMRAIESGKPVLCEKPMGINATECREMVEAARRSNLLLGVAQVFRFERSTATLRERVTAGLIGKPVFARSEFSFRVRNHPRVWITNAEIAGGGPIADVGVHCIDALRYILADEVVRVATIGISDPGSGDVEAAAVLSLEFVRTTLASVLVSARAEYRTPFEIVGDAGTLGADDAFTVDRQVDLELRRGGSVVEKETLSNADAYARQVYTFSCRQDNC